MQIGISKAPDTNIVKTYWMPYASYHADVFTKGDKDVVHYESILD